MTANRLFGPCVLLVGALLASGVSPSLRAEEKTRTTERALTDKQTMIKIRNSIVEDETLPYCAHIVHVKASKGKVTLKGKVFTEQEKSVIGKKAALIVGPENVVNNIIVKDSSSRI